MNILGALLPSADPDSTPVTFGGNTFYVNANNYRSVADRYWSYQQSKFGNQTERDREAYYDTFAQYAEQESKNYTLDSNGAAVPNGQGWSTYLWKTVTGGLKGSAEEINRKLPDGRDYKLIVGGLALVALVVLLKR